ncbi:internal head protein [Pseudomonas phage 201phi2-1]|uniref:Virion structural protein n=1 Tax=Pseudomonas phage 201phi2-1 TaxID=198110 RepID=B3FJ19_BP201|nr:internal head protein [Pseudomonas phage 201phi2-1]ABY62986.1 virion structural protein [Pseudomonas phage 201phi2-1]
MTDDTRQDPHNRPALSDSPVEPVEENIIVTDVLDECQDLIIQRAALERYRDQLVQAGPDGLDHVAKHFMLVGLQQLKVRKNSTGMESFDADRETVTVEDFSEWLSNLGERIKQLINKLIALAKQAASKIMSGIEGVKTQSEELMERARKSARRPSNERHGEGKEITIDSPSLLWTDGEFCVGDCKSEQNVVKFFVGAWPKYAIDQIQRAKKMISEYDVESGNSDNFESNMGFIGNHQSLVATVTRDILPGNKQIAFKYVALGPELVDAEDAQPAPDKHSFEIRTLVEITSTLKQNVATMNALGQMYRSESEVLTEMATLADALMKLEGRRGETVWKSARDGLDDISKAMMDLIGRLKPNYDPIVRHLAKVGTARNAVCRKELDALGQ